MEQTVSNTLIHKSPFATYNYDTNYVTYNRTLNITAETQNTISIFTHGIHQEYTNFHMVTYYNSYVFNPRHLSAYAVALVLALGFLVRGFWSLLECRVSASSGFCRFCALRLGQSCLPIDSWNEDALEGPRVFPPS